MLRAEELALEQAANLQLLQIREKELQYFLTNFNTFGTQSALIGGFVLSALTSINPADYQSSKPMEILLYVSSGVALTASMHGVLATTFCTVWGPGLALRGPKGSVVKAVDGMIQERSHIFFSFVIAAVAFQCMALSVAFIVMERPTAISVAAILFFGGIVVYKYCQRIYQKFKVESDLTDWRDSDAQRHADGVESFGGGSGPRPYSPPPHDKHSSVASSARSGPPSTEQLVAPSSPTESTRRGILRGRGLHLRRRREDPAPAAGATAGEAKDAAVAPAADDASEDDLAVRMEGWISKKGVSTSMFKPDPWSRRYFVLLSGGTLLFYRSRDDSRDPTRQSRRRPIPLSGYSVIVGESPAAPYELRLQPSDEDDARRVWHLRVDTPDELRAWVEALEQCIAAADANPPPFHGADYENDTVTGTSLS